MLNPLESLPEDPAELRAVSEFLMAGVQSLTYQDEKLKAELHGHRKARSGSRSESMDQPAFDLQEDEEIEAAANEQKNEAGSNGTDVDETDKPARRRHSRNPLPDHLDRQDAVLSPGEDCTDCGGSLCQIGEDVTEELEYVPGRFVVRRILHPRMACTCCETFAQAPLPSRPIVRAMPAMRRLIGFAPGWARSPWITSFSSRRSRRWRRATLSGAGGRSDERRHLDLHGQGLRRLPGVPGLESEPGQRVPGPATGPDRGRAAPPPGTTRPLSDADLVGEIRQVITNSRFHGEGYRKVWARLRYKGIRTSKVRVLRLMRENGLCAKPCQGRHTGQGLMTEPSSRATLTKGQGMWGTDMTATLLSTGRQVAVDHCSAGCVGIHAAIRGTRFEALQPIRQGVRDCFGACATDVAAGLTIRHDNGSQYISHDFQNEIAWLGAKSSPSLVRAPEGNGCAERFIRTLKENLLWITTFNTMEELQAALQKFKDDDNEHWLIQSHGHRSPNQFRRDAMDKIPTAA